jgi:hypothetical protein
VDSVVAFDFFVSLGFSRISRVFFKDFTEIVGSVGTTPPSVVESGLDSDLISD